MMPSITLALPTGETIPVFHATNSTGAAGRWFNAKRMGITAEDAREQYQRKIPELQTALMDEIERSGITFDTVISPPSSGADVEPYRQAVIERWSVRDLSKNLTRKGKTKAMKSETTLEDMIEEFTYTPDGSEPSIRSIMIVDESIASGKTAAAILHHLRAAGLPKGTTIAVAACVKMG